MFAKDAVIDQQQWFGHPDAIPKNGMAHRDAEQSLSLAFQDLLVAQHQRQLNAYRFEK